MAVHEDDSWSRLAELLNADLSDLLADAADMMLGLSLPGVVIQGDVHVGDR